MDNRNRIRYNIKGIIYKLLRKSFIAAWMFLPLGIYMSSCTLETSDNGHFDGYWHLERVDTLATGGWCDYSQCRIFWGVQYKLLSCTDADNNSRAYYFRFDQTSDSIIVHTPYKNNWHQDNGPNGGDIPVIVVNDDLRLYGINNLREPFFKEMYKSDKMILRSETLRLYFKKF